MGCAHIHDFIAGTTIALATPRVRGPGKRDRLDIVRPNLGAAELVTRHMRMLESLGARPNRGRPVQ